MSLLNQCKNFVSRRLLTVAQAAELIGVTPRRVQAMIGQPCPVCGRSGEHPAGVACARCHGQGRYLPALRFGDNPRAAWMIVERDLALVEGRRVGRRIKSNPG